jgi:hypothetical protein
MLDEAHEVHCGKLFIQDNVLLGALMIVGDSPR